MTLCIVIMRLMGVSVPEAVREIISRNRSVYDCMKMDVINYTALAVKIQGDVERAVGNSVNLNTIVVAIKRYADSLDTKDDVKEVPILKNARLSLTDGILDIKISNLEGGIDPIELMNRFSQITKDYEFFRFSDSVRFLAEDIADVRRIVEEFPLGNNLFSSGLAKIKISIPVDQNRSDIVSFVAEILHQSGIEIINAYFGRDSIIIILKEMDASKAYEILHNEIVRT